MTFSTAVGAGHSAPQSHDPFSHPAGCASTAGYSPCLCHHPHHRVSRYRRRLHQLLAIGEWAAGLTQDQLATVQAARFKGRYIPPSESAIRRALQRSDAAALDRILTHWMAEYGSPKAIACDGKTLRGSGSETTKPRHLVAAVVHGSTRIVAQTAVDQKSHEIPAMYPLLEPLELTGTLVTADALHTQTDLATYLVEDKQADYLFIAQGNQPTLEADIRALQPEDFSPSGGNLGQRPWTHCASCFAHPHHLECLSGLSACSAGVSMRTHHHGGQNRGNPTRDRRRCHQL